MEKPGQIWLCYVEQYQQRMPVRLTTTYRITERSRAQFRTEWLVEVIATGEQVWLPAQGGRLMTDMEALAWSSADTDALNKATFRMMRRSGDRNGRWRSGQEM